MHRFAIALALAGLAGPVLAQDGPHRGGGMMRADTNGDGVVTREEALAQAAQRFDRMDLNHDGKLTADEMEQAGARMRAMRNGDSAPPPGDNAAPRR